MPLGFAAAWSIIINESHGRYEASTWLPQASKRCTSRQPAGPWQQADVERTQKSTGSKRLMAPQSAPACFLMSTFHWLLFRHCSLLTPAACMLGCHLQGAAAAAISQ
jgi:hypothetical protein